MILSPVREFTAPSEYKRRVLPCRAPRSVRSNTGVFSMEMALHCRNHWDVVEGLRQCSRCGQTFCRDCLVDINGFAYCASCKNEQLLDVRSGVTLTTNGRRGAVRSEEHTSELQSRQYLVCRLLLEKKKTNHGPGPRMYFHPAR